MLKKKKKFQGFLRNKSLFQISFSVKVPKEEAKPVPEEKGTYIVDLLNIFFPFS